MYSGNLSAAGRAALHGLERRMTHPTARNPATGNLRRDTDTREAATGYAVRPDAGLPRSAGGFLEDSFDPAFHTALANFVEIGTTPFHYSVIDRHASAWPATGYVGRRPFYDEVQPRESRCERLARASVLPSSARPPNPYPGASAPGFYERSLTSNGPAAFWTGGRKNDADNYDFTDTIQVSVTDTSIRMMRIDENIPATNLSYATVAPILHSWLNATPADRGTTLNNGAAA
jgi:hypothetical protein